MIEYWHWHTLHVGAETYWGGVLPHSQVPGRIYAEVADLGALLAGLGDRLDGYTPDADVAILYSTDSKQSFEDFPPLCNPDGSSLAEVIYSKRIAECEFTHGYNHFWRGSGAVARRSFLAAMRGGVLPTRSFIYVCLTPIRRMLGVRQT